MNLHHEAFREKSVIIHNLFPPSALHAKVFPVHVSWDKIGVHVVTM